MSACPATYHYLAEVLDGLASLGIRPTSSTDPTRVREYLNDLYRWELRQLRDLVRSGQLPKHLLSVRVIELRKRYTLLSRPLETWTRAAGQDGAC